ncbi:MULTISPECIES: hypothetical protein [unclassified Corallococcus]|uniref:hypothetical protein n=1 Tax=unclassified Corallococcus TaxID=2685029 RepID=UPI001A8E61BE|nr:MULTISPECIES: hypothetical protein [unclassified Corallococcus]MBN9688491.1 hypothetical protein [Corallococcus sp. NCSPR001]WAS87707.1 hypothetical protein O0N60_12190 [Corallococcus sp. NCRR]
MKKTGMMLGLCVAMGLSTASFAGEKFSYPVAVDTTNQTFSGSMGTARNSTDTLQILSCFYSTSFVSCFAQDDSGVSASCLSTDAELVATVRALGSDSYLQVNYDNAGTCTSIIVGAGSYFEPKQP